MYVGVGSLQDRNHKPKLVEPISSKGKYPESAREIIMHRFKFGFLSSICINWPPSDARVFAVTIAIILTYAY